MVSESPERVWSRFEVSKKDGTTLKLRIQELPANRKEDILDLMVDYFMKDEAVNKAVGIMNNPEALNESRQFFTISLNKPTCHIVICCEDNTSYVKSILGVSIMFLASDSDSPDDIKTEPKTKEYQKLFEILEDMSSNYDPLKELDLHSFYDGGGIIIHPKYRQLGIAAEFLKMRSLVCKEHKIPMTGAWMTSFGSQKVAEKNNWETVCEVSFEDLGRKYGVTFKDVPETSKFMMTRVDF